VVLLSSIAVGHFEEVVAEGWREANERQANPPESILDGSEGRARPAPCCQGRETHGSDARRADLRLGKWEGRGGKAVEVGCLNPSESWGLWAVPVFRDSDLRFFYRGPFRHGCER
jgi:hypothetical protein